jgi:hypothetical protein
MKSYSEAERQVLIVLRRLEGQMAVSSAGPPTPRNGEALREYGKQCFGDSLADWADALLGLEAASLLTCEGGLYTLTEPGGSVAQQLDAQEKSRRFGQIMLEAADQGVTCTQLVGTQVPVTRRNSLPRMLCEFPGPAGARRRSLLW